MMKGLLILLESYLYYQLPYFGHFRIKSVKLKPELEELLAGLLGLFKSERTSLTAKDCESENTSETDHFGCIFDKPDIYLEKHCTVKMFTSLFGDSHFNDVTEDATARTIAVPPQNTDGTYHVAMGSRLIKNLCIKIHASWPHHDKFLVKERITGIHGITRVKLKLKSCQMSRYYTR